MVIEVCVQVLEPPFQSIYYEFCEQLLTSPSLNCFSSVLRLLLNAQITHSYLVLSLCSRSL